MRFFLLNSAVFLLVGLIGALPAEARSICRGKPHITLDDGARACVLMKEITELKRTRTGHPGEASDTQIQTADGGAVIVNFPDEETYRDVPPQSLEFRRNEICDMFRDEFRAKIARPRDPFMVVIMTWGDRPSPDKKTEGSWLESFHGRLCNTLRSRR